MFAIGYQMIVNVPNPLHAYLIHIIISSNNQPTGKREEVKGVARARTAADLRDAREIGWRIGARRTQAGLSQEELAARVGIDRTGISKIENGSRMPDTAVLIALSEALGVSPAGLLPSRLSSSTVSGLIDHDVIEMVSQMDDATRGQFNMLMQAAARGFLVRPVGA